MNKLENKVLDGMNYYLEKTSAKMEDIKEMMVKGLTEVKKDIGEVKSKLKKESGDVKTELNKSTQKI